VNDAPETSAAPAETPAYLDEPPQPAEQDEREPRPSWWARLTGRTMDHDQRLTALDEAIAGAPEAAVNYVLRGELLLQHGVAEEAAADFQQALHLAETDLAASRWGLSAQVTRDRALTGLRDARRRAAQG
jgi:tetratricopeptide (TPR) repeat protein